jgi:lipid II:glycine glycyltransferase (peptidoglycan interpeptide bridge formation enzyme)
MKKWYKYNSKTIKWNDLLVETGQNSMYNQDFWIELKIDQGWDVSKLVYLNDKGKFNSVLVIFVKKYLNFSYLWSPAGLSFSDNSILDISLSELKKYLNENFKLFYFRMNNIDLFSPHRNYYFNKHLFQPRILLTSGFTVINDLNIKVDDLLLIVGAKKRYYLKAAISQNLKWEIGTNDQILSKVKFVFNNFLIDTSENFKMPSGSELDYFAKHKDFVFIVGIKDEVPVTSAVLNVTGNTPIYLYAATTKYGRELSASYSMICSIIDYLISREYKKFDMFGISPFDRGLSGIEKFKLTFKGDISKYNGEWEFGSFFTRLLGNFIIKYKKI